MLLKYYNVLIFQMSTKVVLDFSQDFRNPRVREMNRILMQMSRVFEEMLQTSAATFLKTCREIHQKVNQSFSIILGDEPEVNSSAALDEAQESLAVVLSEALVLLVALLAGLAFLTLGGGELAFLLAF